MATDKEAEELDRTLSNLQSQSRALSDAMRKLAEEGVSALSREATSGARSTARRQDAGDIAAAELSRVLKAELSEGLRHIFAPGRSESTMNGGGLNVIIHNNTSAQVSAQETTGAYDRRTLEITIDQMVAQSLVHGRQTGSVLQNLFGLVPSLIGR